MTKQTKTVELTDAQMAIVEKVEKALTLLGVQYAIRLPNDVMLGNLNAVKNKRASYEFPRGEVHEYVGKHLKDLKLGESMFVPADKYGIPRIQSACCRWMSRTHGKNLYTSERVEGGVRVDFNAGL